MKIEFSSQRRETLFVLDHQHTKVTSLANQQLLMLATCKYRTFPYFDARTYSVPLELLFDARECFIPESLYYKGLTHHLVSFR